MAIDTGDTCPCSDGTAGVAFSEGCGCVAVREYPIPAGSCPCVEDSRLYTQKESADAVMPGVNASAAERGGPAQKSVLPLRDFIGTAQVLCSSLEVRTITCTTRESRRSAVMEMLKTIKSAGLIF